MIEIKISKDFTFAPGARDYDDGKFSGQEFFDKILKDKFEEAQDADVKLRIDLDGVEGYPSSFLSESFGLLGNLYGGDETWNRLSLISNEVPKYIKKIKLYIYEERE